MEINKILAQEFNLKQQQVDNTVALIDDDKTIPFIARYRKELTGSLDDTVLRELFDRLQYLRNLEKRKADITASITEQGKMTEELALAIEKAVTLVEVEDIYLPYKQKRKTRASVAREKGLEPLAEMIFVQNPETDPQIEADNFINPEVDLDSVDKCLQGAMDIIAENISDNADIRKTLRKLFFDKAKIVSKAVDSEAKTVYENYYDFSEPVNKIAGHRILAIDRGEK